MKKKKKIIPKYLTGVQAIETPQADFAASGDFLKQGLATAAASGNPVIAGTSLLAGGVGELVNQATLPKKRELLRKRMVNANTQNTALANNQGMDVNAAVQYNRLMPGTEFIAEDGLIVPNKSLIEVEKNELVFRKVGSKTKLVADFQNGKLHNEGGEDYVAQEGDIIMPKNKRKKVMNMIDKSSGFVIDKLRFEREVNKLPKDKDKAMLGTVVGGGINLLGGLISNIAEASDLGEGRSHRLAQDLVPIGDVTSVVGSGIAGLDSLGLELGKEQQTKFREGGTVGGDKTTPIVNTDTYTPKKRSVLRLVDQIRDQYYTELSKMTPQQQKEFINTVVLTDKKFTKTTPLKFRTGGVVGKDGKTISVDPVDNAISIGEQEYFNYNNPNPNFLDPTEFAAGPRAEILPEQQSIINDPQKKFFLDTYARNLSTPKVNTPKVNTSVVSNDLMTPIRPKFRNQTYTTTNKGQGLANTAGIDESVNLSTSNISPTESISSTTKIGTNKDGVFADTVPIKNKKKRLNIKGAGLATTANLASALITKENANPEYRNSDLLEAEHLTAIDTGDPDRQAALMNKEGAKRFRRNAGGGNIQQVTSAMSADDQEYLNQVNRINAGQADKFQQLQNQNVQIDNAVNQYNTDRRNADIDINDANRAQARNVKRSFRSNLADAAQQSKVDNQVAQRDANAEAENIRANALKAGVAEQQHQEIMKAIETKRQYDQGSLELISKANSQADVNLRDILIKRFGLTEDQAKVYLGKGELYTGAPNLSGIGLSENQKRKLTYGRK